MNKCNVHNNQDLLTMKSICYKIRQHDLVITKADKGKTVVITSKMQCNNKIQSFINDNQFTHLDQDPKKVSKNKSKKYKQMSKHN
jgi:hypothetical protein